MRHSAFRMGLLVLILPGFVGCAGAWVVSQNPDGGVIGYHKAEQVSSSVEAPAAVKGLIPCDNFQIVKDEVRSSWSPGSGNGQATREPVTQWHEMSYACKDGAASDRSISSLNSGKSGASVPAPAAPAVTDDSADGTTPMGSSIAGHDAFGRPSHH
jgi:hypothetical protein